MEGKGGESKGEKQMMSLNRYLKNVGKKWPRNIFISKVGIKTIMKSHEYPLEWP